MLCAAGCGARGHASAGGSVHVTIVRLSKDTVRFTAPATALRCQGSRGWIVSGQEGGNGALIWFRPADALDSTGVLRGHYQLRGRDDTTPGRAAFASVRYMKTDTPHGLNVDAGSADLADTTPPLGARLEGLGLEATQAQQVSVVARFESLRVADSTPCGRP